MPNFIADETVRLPVDAIVVLRDSRQREFIITDDLEESLQLRGLINPIVVRFDEALDAPVLVAGERRLTAAKALGWTDIPARYTLRDLSDLDLQILELEENSRRQDLSWQEHVKSILRIHHLCLDHNGSGWTYRQTADLTGYAEAVVYKMCAVAEALDRYAALNSCPSWSNAWSVLSGIRERELEAAEAALHKDIALTFKTPAPVTGSAPSASESESAPESETPGAVLPAEVKAPEPAAAPIINWDFIEFANTYSGPAFNLLHIDFPYGIDHGQSDQGNRSGTNITYDDSEDLYWTLCRTLTSRLSALVSSSAHIVFWHAWKHHVATRQFFAEQAPDLWLQDVPLIWHKTDNRGIMADASRRPRNTTEVAFLISRGDRKLVKAVANSYGAPTSKEVHQSEKPVPVLRHFLSMMVDENSRLLDPTSGSGSALIAADSLGAASVLGIEKDPEYHLRSSKVWDKYYRLKTLSERND